VKSGERGDQVLDKIIDAGTEHVGTIYFSKVMVPELCTYFSVARLYSLIKCFELSPSAWSPVNEEIRYSIK